MVDSRSVPVLLVSGGLAGGPAAAVAAVLVAAPMASLDPVLVVLAVPFRSAQARNRLERSCTFLDRLSSRWSEMPLGCSSEEACLLPTLAP